MSSEWLKVQKITPDKPEVWAIASGLGLDPDAVFGKLFRVWSWFDEHSESGNAPSVTAALLDRVVGVTGFCDAVVAAGWMFNDGTTLTLPNFDRHNGKTAKSRALTAKRVADHKRSGNAKGNAPSVTTALPRKEKEKKKSNTPPKPPKGGVAYSDEFEAFWAEYPNRKGKVKSAEYWEKLPESDKQAVMSDLHRRKQADRDWQRDGGRYIPHASTYLNQRRWEDDIQEQAHDRETPAEQVRRAYERKFAAQDGGPLGTHDADIRGRLDVPLWAD